MGSEGAFYNIRDPHRGRNKAVLWICTNRLKEKHNVTIGRLFNRRSRGKRRLLQRFFGEICAYASNKEEMDMCSIMGYCGKSMPLETFQKGFDRTISRGPDDARIIHIGNGLFGFHRLAIMGLQPEGMQPFSLDGEMCIRDRHRAMQRQWFPPSSAYLISIMRS